MTFGELKTYVTDILGRSDIPIAAYVAAQDDWNRKLRMQENEIAVTLSSPYILPTGYRSIVEITVADGGSITAYRVSGDRLEFDEEYTGTVNIVYIGSNPMLINAGDSNFILNKYAQVAIYGVLYHTCIMIRDAEGMAAFGQVYSTALTDAIKADNRARFSGGQMIPTPRDAA